MQVSTIGLDIAKNVFQVHGIDAAEKVVVRKQLRRRQVLEFFNALPPCLVGMEACATAHYWARELTKLGHRVRLMPAKDVKAYVKRNKNDAADAEAICEAVRRPTMRFVQIKSADQQSRLMLHRTRDLLMRQRTQLINALRAHMAELGIVAAQGNAGLKELLKIIAGERDARLPVDAHASLVVLAAGLHAVQTMIGSIDKRIIVEHRSNEASKRLRSIPGIGPLGASAIAATVQDPKAFRSGRDFAAWIGLVPREDFDRWQAQAWADLETGRSLFAAHSGGGSPCGIETRAAEAGKVSLAHATPGATTLQGRGGRACQQDGARSLGVAGQRRHLFSGACACHSRSGLIRSRQWEDEVASVRSRTARVMTTSMRNGRDRRSDNPSGPTRDLSACYCLGPISGSHQGQRPQRPHRDGGKPPGENRPYTWLHPNASQTVRFLLHRGRRPYMALSRRARPRQPCPLSGAKIKTYKRRAARTIQHRIVLFS